MDTAIAVYEPETQNDPQPVGQYFSLPAPKSETLPEIPKELIDRLFVRLWAWYGKLIEDKWGADTELAKSVWREDLAGLTMKQLKGGMERCRDECKFPPTLPEFRALCLGAGRINAEEHWKICVAGRYKSRAHYWAVQRYGYSDLHNHKWDHARFRFPAILRDCMIDERAGELPEIPEHVMERLQRVGCYQTAAL